MIGKLGKYIGPGPLIAAAFIGPGTVTVCTIAGVKFGYDLLWALGLSILATIVLQEMASRIGLLTGKGLATVISESLSKGLARYFSLMLIFLAIVVGNAAYEAGNISGGAMGLGLFVQIPEFQLGPFEVNLLNLSLGMIAWGLLMLGSYKRITQVLTFLVILMSLAFLLNVFMVKPAFAELAAGFVPKVNSLNIIQIVALIGTTVVPYNLFLHSSLVSQRWSSIKDLKYARVDTVLSVVLGGLVSMAIVITAAGTGVKEVQSAAELAIGVEPLLGQFAKYFIGFGLFAAGITSAITAPLAGAFVVCGVFGWSVNMAKPSMKWSISIILGLGLLFASFGLKPVQLINLAQLANGTLLPLLSAYILWLANKSGLMHQYKNSVIINIMGFLVWLITLGLGMMSVAKVFNWI